MKLRTTLKIATVTSVILLCVGIAFSLYFKMSTTERAEDFDLYTLVPADSKVIVDTDNMVGLMQSINEMSCSKDNHFLYFSRFFVYLKDHINTLLEDTPHGLSKQMNKMLISFHDPENDRNQVFYCRFGVGDYEFMEEFIKKYFASSFPSHFFDYRGEEIRIYPMPDDTFLSCYATTEFLVLSYQKRLVEHVIDTYLDKKSILSDKNFQRVYADQKLSAPARIYTPMLSVKMGKDSDGLRFQTDIGNWTEFIVNLNEDIIYLSGINSDTDSCSTFAGTVRTQNPMEGFSGAILPQSTFLFFKTSISHPERMAAYTAKHDYAKATYSNAIIENDKAVFDFLRDYTGHEITTCMFNREDTLLNFPHAVMTIPIKNRAGFKHALTLLCGYASPHEGVKLPCYALPQNTIFAKLTGITDSSLHTYAFIYKDRLLISPHPADLQAYMESVENGKAVLEGTPDYEVITSKLLHTYNFMMVADMKQVLDQPESYVRFIPNLFFRYSKFFRHFVITSQFTYADDQVYPTLVLFYKGEESSQENPNEENPR